MPKKSLAPDKGTRFGRRVVVSGVLMEGPNGKLIRRHVYCECDCGEVDLVRVSKLIAGSSQMCTTCRRGAHNPRRTHNFSGIPEYRIWACMVQRCNDPNKKRYKHISICDEWLGPGGFDKFFAELGPRPSSKHSIDRIDNTGNYEPGNVRWATPKQQARNRKNTPMLTIFGKTRSVAEWAETAKVKYHTFRKRLKLGWSPEDAVRGVRSNKPKHRIRKDTPSYEIDGATKTLHEWAAKAGVSSSTFRARIDRLGWTAKESLQGRRSGISAR
mgnify:CR=1 FL=1|jgi:hypothetical protein